MSTIGLLVVGGAVVSASLFTPNTNIVRKLEIEMIILDEQDNPVENVRVETTHYHWLKFSHGSFMLRPLKKNVRDWEVTTIRYTNSKGFCKLSFYTDDPRANLKINKEGYYLSNIKLSDQVNTSSGRWNKHPEERIIRLKQIKNPTFLVFNNMRNLKNPLKLNEPIGYDIIKNNFLPPYGNGEINDISIIVNKLPIEKPGTPYASLRFVFHGEGNGIQGIPNDIITPESQFVLPYEAFNDGYKHNELFIELLMPESLKRTHHRANIEGDYFVFRIRSIFDETEKLVSAFYWVILYPIYIEGRKNEAIIECGYIFNPLINSRNLEPMRNEHGQIIPYEGPILP